MNHLKITSILIFISLLVLTIHIFKPSFLSVFAQTDDSLDDNEDDDDDTGADCDPNTSWVVTGSGCDSAGSFFDIRLNLCTNEAEPYFNPRKISGLCTIDGCQLDSEFNQFQECGSVCGQAVFACDSDPSITRTYFQRGQCSTQDSNLACTDTNQGGENPTPNPEVTSNPQATPLNNSSPSPTPTANPQASSSPNPSKTVLKVMSQGQEIDLNRTIIKEGQEINLNASLPKPFANYYCLWNFEGTMDEKNQPLELRMPCSIILTFREDSLNEGKIKVSVRIIEILDGKENRGEPLFTEFRINELTLKAACSDILDFQVYKECILKQSQNIKEPTLGKPLGPLMLCLLDQENIRGLNNSNAGTVSDAVSTVKQKILLGKPNWGSYPICLGR